MGIRKNSAFTLQELLVVIAVIAVMMVILVSSARTLKRQSELRDAKNTLLVLSMAVEKYHEIHGKYPFEAKPYLPDAMDLDDIGFTRADLVMVLGSDAWGYPEPKVQTANYQASIETLYRFLENDPQTAAIIAAIPEKFLTAKNSDGDVISLAGMPLIRIVDPWGMPYRYMFETGYGVAIVESAGPDGKFARVPASEDNDDEKQKDLDNISY